MLFYTQQKCGVGTFAASDAAQLFHHQTHVVIVEVNTAFHRLLHGMPVSLFKALLRAGGHFQKSTILGVETLQNRLSNQ